MNERDREAAIEAEVTRVSNQVRKLLGRVYDRIEEDGDDNVLFREWGVLGIMNWNNEGDEDDLREDIVMTFENKNAHVQIGMLRMASIRSEDPWSS
jgi:hypothetical protein